MISNQWCIADIHRLNNAVFVHGWASSDTPIPPGFFFSRQDS